MEYLIVLVNDNLMDPADIMSSNDLIRVLERGFVPPPVKTNRMTDEQYRQLLLQVSVEPILNEISFHHLRLKYFHGERGKLYI